MKQKKYTIEDITVGFEFNFNGKDVVIKTDYSKSPELNSNTVQIVYRTNEDASAGQLDKDALLNLLNTETY